jgi:hypothetical protein
MSLRANVGGGEGSMNPPRIETVTIVTPEHGQAFAQGWYDSDGMMTACYDTGIMTWPDGTLEDHAALDHFHDLEDEILHEVFESTKQAIAEAFVKAANAVLDRERGRRDA